MWKRLLERWTDLLERLGPSEPDLDAAPAGADTNRLQEELGRLADDRRRLLQKLEYYRSYGLNTLVREYESALQIADRRYRSLKTRLHNEGTLPETRTEPS